MPSLKTALALLIALAAAAGAIVAVVFALQRSHDGVPERLRSCAEARGAHAVKTSEGLASARPTCSPACSLARVPSRLGQDRAVLLQGADYAVLVVRSPTNPPLPGNLLLQRLPRPQPVGPGRGRARSRARRAGALRRRLVVTNACSAGTAWAPIIARHARTARLGPETEPNPDGSRPCARAGRVVTRAELLAAGVSRSAIGRALRAGKLHHVHRGVYATVAPELLTEDGHLLAALLAAGDGALLAMRRRPGAGASSLPLPR